MAADAETARAAAPQQRLLRVVGHPRCASGYMATLFAAYGLQIGHERLLADGIASWMHTVNDLQTPYGDAAVPGLTFTHTVAHVRDPAAAIPSIMLENGIGPSFHFRRQHILRATGDNIARYGTAIERAVASFLHWHDMALRLKPAAVFRVEDAARPVRLWLAGWHDPALAEAPDRTGLDGYNATSRKAAFLLPKPILHREDWLAMAAPLRDRLADFCATHGYARPWEPQPD